MKHNNKIRHIISLSLLAVIAGYFAVTKASGCIYEYEKMQVYGTSMTGVLEPGVIVLVKKGHYTCNKPERNDLVIYKLPSEKLVKIIKAIPGDRVELVKEEDSSNYNLVVNDWVLRNSEADPYKINQRSFNILNGYIQEYGGVVPNNAYIILGNKATGSKDSTQFGLVSINDFLGKVVKY